MFSQLSDLDVSAACAPRRLRNPGNPETRSRAQSRQGSGTRSATRRTLLIAIMYSLPTACPVKWTATQERSILSGYPNVADLNVVDPRPSAVKILYLQFLWLPEVICFRRRLFPPLTFHDHFR